MTELVVVLGAGASYDCTSTSVEKVALRPPLVKDLFQSTERFGRILNAYPLAEMAAAQIRNTLAREAVALEEFLRKELRDSDDAYARLRYRQIPLYLQDLFFKISQRSEPDDVTPRGYTRHADHYDVLLNVTLALARVVYITLNYDTLFDDRLASYRRGILSMDDYIRPDRNWSLIKLHGSVNWGRKLRAGLDADAIYLDRASYVNMIDVLDELELDETIELRSGDLETMRYDGGPAVYYPALSAPLGSQDELSCPPNHVDFLAGVLRSMDAVNLLVVGYSGYDTEVVRLLSENAAGIKTLLVANGSRDASGAAADRIMRSRGFLEASAFDGGFTQLIATGALQEHVSQLA